MDPRNAQASKPHVALLLAKGKLVGCLTTGQSKRSTLDSSDINNFHDLLQVAIRDTTRSTKEFKKCIAWILCHVAKSRRRVAAFGEYLLRLSDSLLADVPQPADDQAPLLHAQLGLEMIHLIDAIFFRIRHNPGRLLRKPLNTYMTFAKGIETTVTQLVELAAPVRGIRALSAHRDLACLLQQWTGERLFTNRTRLVYRSVARKAYMTWLDWLEHNHRSHFNHLITKLQPDNVENDFPATHGSPDDAWYDLPVGNMVHAMGMTRPGHPIKVARMNAVNMPVGSVDSDLLETVFDHIEECKSIDAIPNIPTTDDDSVYMLNGLGLRLRKDIADQGDTASHKVIEGYYGFSVPFMKVFQRIEQRKTPGPDRPQNWIPPPPPDFTQSPSFHTNLPPNAHYPPLNRDIPSMGGAAQRQRDHGRAHGMDWHDETRGGGGGNWRGRGRGWGGSGRGRY